MQNILTKLRKMPLGGWVLVAMLLATISSSLARGKANDVASALSALRPRVGEQVQMLMYREAFIPQAFTKAPTTEAAEKLRDEIIRAQKFVDSKKPDDAQKRVDALTYHCFDVLFMCCYGPLLLLGALWGKKRAELLTGNLSKIGNICKWIWPIAILAALVGVGGDVGEYFACTKILNSPQTSHIPSQWLTYGALATHLKVIGTAVSVATGLLLGAILSLISPAVLAHIKNIPATWELIVRTHRFAMHARFSVLAGAVFTVLLLTQPGQDIVRTVATGPFKIEPLPTSTPDFERLGWFAVAILLLAVSCWGWARLVLAVRLESPAALPPNFGGVEDRLRRDLPIYYGAVPFVAAACAFAIAPMRDKLIPVPTTQFFAASIAPLLLFFLLPLGLVITRANTAVTRQEVGPLSWTLIGYCALALLHAISEWQVLGQLGLIPLVLLGVALPLFGLGKPQAIFALPIALLVGALHGPHFLNVLVPSILLVLIGVAACWANRARNIDELHIPAKFPTKDLLRLALPGNRPLRDQTGVAIAPPIVQQLSGLMRLCTLLLAAQVVLFIVLTIWQQPLPLIVGSGAMLALGFGGWATVGGALIFITQATRFPIVGSALLLAVLCSGMMDNHKIRLAEKTTEAAKAAQYLEQHHKVSQDPVNKDPIGDAFDKWRNLAMKDAKDATEPPCIIVATEGGGIRAAFWTATVLSTLQSQSLMATNQPDFSSHVFAISGISGGSVGAAVFAALCAEHRDAPDLRLQAARICGADHLSPIIGALLYPDLVQRFLPFACLPDRAQAFEKSLENVALNCGSTDRMAKPFTSLWSDDTTKWRPALFLNGTMVETGKRIIASPLPIYTAAGGNFIDSNDLHEHLREFGPGVGAWRDLPLSAAAHTSARFPLVSPPGRLPSGARVVDGGYFESSAAATGLDLLNAVAKYRDTNNLKTPLVFIFLRFADSPGLTDTPEQVRNALRSGQQGSNKIATQREGIPIDDQPLFPATNLLDETTGIVHTLLGAWNARGTYAQNAISDRYLASPETVVLSFTVGGDNIPLSWSLSQESCNAMLQQFPVDLYGKGTADVNLDNTEHNRQMAKALLEGLYPDFRKKQ